MTERACYNCGPGLPAEKWLCAKCANLYEFVDERMTVKPPAIMAEARKLDRIGVGGATLSALRSALSATLHDLDAANRAASKWRDEVAASIVSSRAVEENALRIRDQANDKIMAAQLRAEAAEATLQAVTAELEKLREAFTVSSTDEENRLRAQLAAVTAQTCQTCRHGLSVVTACGVKVEYPGSVYCDRWSVWTLLRLPDGQPFGCRAWSPRVNHSPEEQ